VNALLFKTKHFLMIWLFIMHLAVSNCSFMLVNVSICYAFRLYSYPWHGIVYSGEFLKLVLLM